VIKEAFIMPENAKNLLGNFSVMFVQHLLALLSWIINLL